MRDLTPGAQVFELGNNLPMHIEGVESDGQLRCWHFAPDGSGKRLKRWFRMSELETLGERNSRCAEEDAAREIEEDRTMGRTRPRRVLYDV